MGAQAVAVSTQVATDRHVTIATLVTVIFPTTGHQTFRMRVIYKGRQITGDFFVPMGVAQVNFPQQLDVQELREARPRGLGVGRAPRHRVGPEVVPDGHAARPGPVHNPAGQADRPDAQPRLRPAGPRRADRADRADRHHQYPGAVALRSHACARAAARSP
jgi:hypothetical protein